MEPVPSWFWPAFLSATAALALFTWRISIRAKRYHGVTRFFAFEGIVALFLLNARFWFRDPLAPIHILAWAFLAASLLLAIHSIALYMKLSAPQGQIENSTRLVAEGAYKFIRHPMYASLALIALGIVFKRVTALTAALAVAVLLAVYLTARIEEGEMRARFGSEYEDYRRRTKMFVPFLFLFLAAFNMSAEERTAPFMRSSVSPDGSGSRVAVEAEPGLSGFRPTSFRRTNP